MRVIKPNYVSPLVAPFDDGRRIHCVVTALLHVSFEGQLLKEQDLWLYASADAEGMVLDEGKPKAFGEWLVHGACYARKPGVGISFVKAAVADQEKVLAVFGPRTWTTVGPSTPQPFDVAPIRFDKAFGGAGFAENPIGTGYGGTPPPTVEVRGSFVTTPRDKPPVAGFGRVDPTWPQRMKKAGTYDKKWQETRFPGMAEDFDPTYFNVALPDQWLQRNFEGTESFSFVNMHPDKETVGGKLPGIVGRAFVKRKGEDRMIDVPMHIDTVVFFPHRERLVLVCRGATRTKSDTLADIEQVGLGVEWIDRPKSYEHYMDAFALRRDRRAGVKRLDDTPFVPEGNPAPEPKKRLAPPGEGLAQRQMERRVERQVAELRADLEARGADTKVLDEIPTKIDTSVDPDTVEAPPDPPSLEEVQERVASETKKTLAKVRAEIEKEPGDKRDQALAQFDETSAAILAGPCGPPKLTFDQTRQSILARLDELPADRAETAALRAQVEDPEMIQRARELEDFACETYRSSAQHQRAAPRLGRAESEALRARVIEMAKRAEPFARVDLTGADLSGLDLRGARMSRAFLESANLEGALLEGAELDHAVLARANLTAVDLASCKALVGANLSGAELRGGNLSGLDLTGCFFVGTDLTDARLARTTLDQVDFTKATLRRTDLSGSKAKGLLLHKLRLENVVLREAKWERPLFHESEILGIDLRGAEVARLAFVDTIVEDGVFDDAVLLKPRAARARGTTAFRRCSFVGTVAEKAFFRALEMPACDFRHAVMKEADFSEGVLDDSDFSDARLVGARFMDASIRRCRFDRADLMEALLGGALMDQASFESANLFRADLARTGGDGVNLRGANVKWVRTAPKREELP